MALFLRLAVGLMNDSFGREGLRERLRLSVKRFTKVSAKKSCATIHRDF